MSELKANLKAAITAAMKARDATRLQGLRTALNTLQKKEIDQNRELSQEEAQKALMTLSKQIQESLDQAKTANRSDLAQAAEAELALLREFLPRQLSSAEIEAKVAEIVQGLKSTLPPGGAGMGAAMKEVMKQLGSAADGKTIQAAVKKSLGL